MQRRSFNRILGAAPLLITGRAGRAAPSRRYTLGVIGVGKKGEQHLARLYRHPRIQVIGVAEVYGSFRDRAVAMVNGDAPGSCTGYVDFRELLDRDELDAVVIATPDHWHAIPAILAARAGVDIYCEKPLSLTIEEAGRMVAATRRYARVFQTGSQQRSSGNFRHACELVRNGYIGELQTVHVKVGGASGPCALPAEAVPEGLDWDRWLGPAPRRPFNAVLRPPHNKSFPQWRRYRDYSGGSMTDIGAHHFDIAHWGMGMDGLGPVDILPPGADGELLTFVYGNGVKVFHGKHPEGTDKQAITFTGTEGRVEVNRGHLKTWPEKRVRQKMKPNELHLRVSRNHHDDWIDAMDRRRRPICDVAIGASSVTVCHLGNIAYRLKRPLKWNPVDREFIGDEIANRLRGRATRGTWGVDV